MSEQDVQIIRRVFELGAARDFDSLAKVISEEAELRSAIAGGSTGTVYRGVQGMRDYFADVAEAWERFDQVAEEFVDLGENGVLVIFRVDAQGKASGVELAQRLAVHWTFKDGKPWRGIGYSDVNEARRVLGLA